MNSTQNKIQKNLAMFALALAAAMVFTHANEAHAAGERFCYPQSTSAPVIEAWANPTNIPWEMDLGIVANLVVPGMVPISCIASQTGTDEEDYHHFAGFQSIMRAANRWSKVQVPTVPSGGQSGTGVIVSKKKLPMMQAVQPGPVSIGTANPNPASSFSLAEYPSTHGFNGWETNNSRILALDGINRVTFWEPEGTFQMVGGPFTIAIALVDINLSTGEILEGDIAFNVRTQQASSGQPYWSFVEYNSYLKTWLASHSNADATSYEPVFGFVDIEGVAVHEFGHFAGLGHSLVDSHAHEHKTRFPSMFAWGTGNKPFNETAQMFQSSCTQNQWLSLPVTGTLEGYDARTLEADDVASLGALYPSTNFTEQLGSISGVVDLNGSEVKGAHVVAVHKDHPVKLRVGTLSYEGGAFTIDGLPAGDYFVYVEPVDQKTGPGASSHYFDPMIVPNYVYQGTTGCVPSPVDFHAEFYDVNEDSQEFSAAAVQEVNVQPAMDSADRDLLVGTSTPVLEVRQLNVGNGDFSQRGIILEGPAPYNTVQFSASFGSQHANQPVLIALSARFGFNQEEEQLNLVNHEGAEFISTTTDASGDVMIFHVVEDKEARKNLFVQASVKNPTGTVFTNPVNIWVASP